MADEPKSGTPEGGVADGGNAGTTTPPADGGLMDGLTPDQKALFIAQEKKAAEANKVLDRVRDLEARLAEAQRAQYAQQAADPMAQMVQQLRERAQYGDSDAAAQLSILTLTATQQAENQLTNEMVKGGIPSDKWDVVQGLVRQSGYRMSVGQALQLARGSEVPDLAKQLEAERAKNAALEKALNGQTVNGARPGGNPANTPPAAMSVEDVPLMDAAEYNRLLTSLPEAEAKALRDKGVRLKR